MTTQDKPANATFCMAAAAGIIDSSVLRIRRANGLKFQRLEFFQLSNDSNFSAKLEAIALYMDEKSAAQTLD